jgi:cobalt-zinc-cadmium efflux system membrane fusion protein
MNDLDDTPDRPEPAVRTTPARRRHVPAAAPLLIAMAGIVAGIVITLEGWIPFTRYPTQETLINPAAAAVETAPQLVRKGDQIEVPDGSPYRARLAVAAVQRDLVDQTRTVPGAVEVNPARTYSILPPLGGRVIDLPVHLGDHVTAGQPLASIDSGDLAQAYSDVDKARAQELLTRRALDRSRSLNQIGGGPVKDVEQAANDEQQAQAELARAQARLKTIAGSAAISSNRTLTVAAPAAGSITALAIARGAYINDPTQSMMTVTNVDQVWVTANVPESDIGFVTAGQDVDLGFVAYPGETFRGTVLFINDIMEPDTRRTKVRIAVDNPDGRFKPNMFVNVTFHAPPRSVLVVPDTALLMNNDNTTVFVETAPWTFVRRRVDPGYDNDGKTTIDSGLSAGERVVTRGGVLLND